MISSDHIMGKGLFCLTAILVNALILYGIPRLTTHQARQETGARFDPVFLADYEPPPPPPPKQQPRRPKPKTVRPKEMPRMTVKQKTVPAHRPRMALEMPRIDFEINPMLTTGMAVAPPPVTPAPKVVKAPPSPLRALPSAFEAGDVDEVPEILRKVEPLYPYRARRRNISGEVVVRFLVSLNGHVEKTTIVTARPKGVFEKSVLQAIRRWRFRPGYYQGNPVPTWVELPIQFNLNG